MSSNAPQSQATRQRADQSLIESVHDAWAGLLECAPLTKLTDLGLESISPTTLWTLDSAELLSMVRAIAVHAETIGKRRTGWIPSGVHTDGTDVTWRRIDA
ncbi:MULTISPECIES: hypothetical protein [Mycobacteroides]|uniref:hypothetical protein n=1 Tax=Mycobacteroides TaxID=670516 RepID=UPI0009A7B465|nr:hypothetical protein [Mycobacteroides abscessus]AWG70744.1 hypothetical protein DDT49_19780 [Mycobacteroides abscessus]PVB05510.1 hypothetical protein DDJ51_00080 [Mycobacteroides abscessus]PVB30172.1 hypothetical protein DDJ92_12170 [Mycobacteroides abscessus]SKK72030.1 Uncharacterised protein [Mycobacteroides abscessus subsp. massiliense]SKL19119.1 Uncharacterised protein [Mycobacteroides abscessus subsp. massiliense]